MAGVRPFSIVTICFNDRDGLRRTMESVRQQQADLVQWIVVDGASTDGTAALLDECRAIGASVVCEPDSGIFNAMNKGLAAADGRYINFLNSGDLFADRDVLTRVYEAVKTDTPEFIYGDSIEFGRDDQHYKTAHEPGSIFYSMFTHHQAMFYRRDRVRRGYNESYRFAADWAFTARFLRDARSVRRLSFPICRFARGGSTFSEHNRRILDRELWRIYREEMQLAWPVAGALYFIKTSINRIRVVLPGLYDSLRMARTAWS